MFAFQFQVEIFRQKDRNPRYSAESVGNGYSIKNWVNPIQPLAIKKSTFEERRR